MRKETSIRRERSEPSDRVETNACTSEVILKMSTERMKQTLRVSIFLPFLLLSGDPSRSLSVRLAYEPAAVPPAAFPQPYYIVIRLVTYARAGPGEHPTELLMASLCFFPVCQTWSVVERERERERERLVPQAAKGTTINKW